MVLLRVTRMYQISWVYALFGRMCGAHGVSLLAQRCQCDIRAERVYHMGRSGGTFAKLSENVPMSWVTILECDILINGMTHSEMAVKRQRAFGFIAACTKNVGHIFDTRRAARQLNVPITWVMHIRN